MEYKTIYTNDFSCDRKAQEAVASLLRAGYAVRVDSTCTGHTRAAMVQRQGEEYMLGMGAHDVGTDPFFPMGSHYAL